VNYHRMEKIKIGRIKKESNTTRAINKLMPMMRWIIRIKSVNLER